MAKKKIVRPVRASIEESEPIAAFDVDGSLMREQLLVLMIKECCELGIFRTVADMVFKEIRLRHRDRKVTFEAYDRQIIDLFIDRIKGRRVYDVDFAAQRVFEKHRDWLYVFTKALLAELKKTHKCILITGAMTEVVGKLAPYWGFEQYYGTKLGIDKTGRYTGRQVALPVADKRKALLGHVAKTGQSLKGSVALGDSGTDISMLSAVELPIAFNPNDVLAAEAEKQGWPIVIERKDCIYVQCGGDFRRFSSANAADAVQHVLRCRNIRKDGP